MLKIILFSLLDFLSSILSGVLADKISAKMASMLGFKGLFRTKRSHKRQLKIALEKMPFIYKDLESEVMTDYVNISFVSIDMSTFTESAGVSFNNDISKLNFDSKAVFLGAAGIGKSTFFRYNTISLIQGNPFLEGLKGCFPIFIFLKSVDNIEKSPILHHILKHFPYFERNGIKKLTSIANKHSIFLLLDGYDEINYVCKRNYLQEELTVLLSSSIDENKLTNGQLDPKFFQLYSLLTKNRIWLSTREEFYQINTLNVKKYDYTNDLLQNRSVTGIKLTGLGENRLKLVKIIFDKYRSRSQKYAENLDEEHFIEEIDISSDSELVEFSKRPLFLVVMCFVYIHEIANTGYFQEGIFNNIDDIIEKCVDLLIKDLDEDKVRQEKRVKQNAFMNRRNKFTSEKLEFLRSFALNLFIQNKSIFTYDEIFFEVKSFFTKHESETAKQILHNLENKNSNNPNIVWQLIYSGIFISADLNDETIHYDFPHRRFKEVLASKALSSQINYKKFKNALDNNEMSEFIQFVFTKDDKYRYDIIFELLKTMNRIDHYDRSSQLLINCIDRYPMYNSTTAICDGLDFLFDINQKVYFKKELVSRFHNVNETITKTLKINLGKSISSESWLTVYSICDVLYYVDKEALNSTLLMFKNYPILDPIRNKFELLLQFKSCFKINTLNSTSLTDAVYDKILALFFVQDYFAHFSLIEQFQRLSPKEKIVFIIFAEVYNMDLYRFLSSENAFLSGFASKLMSLSVLNKKFEAMKNLANLDIEITRLEDDVQLMNSIGNSLSNSKETAIIQLQKRKKERNELSSIKEGDINVSEIKDSLGRDNVLMFKTVIK